MLSNMSFDKACDTLWYTPGEDCRNVFAASTGYKAAVPTAPAIPPANPTLHKYSIEPGVVTFEGDDSLLVLVFFPPYVCCKNVRWTCSLGCRKIVSTACCRKHCDNRSAAIRYLGGTIDAAVVEDDDDDDDDEDVDSLEMTPGTVQSRNSSGSSTAGSGSRKLLLLLCCWNRGLLLLLLLLLLSICWAPDNERSLPEG
jgi:hypothetical protein